MTNDNIELSQVEDKTAIDDMASGFLESSDTIQSRNSFNAATSMWRASTSSRVRISKGKDDWRKQNPHKSPREWRNRFLNVNKKHVRTMVAIIITAVPVIMLPPSYLDKDISQALVWIAITSIVLQEETSTGSVLKGR